jgi:micrococcal nuclease
MKLTSILWFLFLPLYLQAEESCTHDDHNFRCVKYIKNYDADTVTFDVPNVHPLLGKNINVRVSGVDTPEVKTTNSCEKKKAINAQKLVANLLSKAKRIDLTNVQRDKYFRVIADIIIDGQSLSQYLLKNGLAYSYDGGTKKNINWCKSNREIATENGGK